MDLCEPSPLPAFLLEAVQLASWRRPVYSVAGDQSRSVSPTQAIGCAVQLASWRRPVYSVAGDQSRSVSPTQAIGCAVQTFGPHRRPAHRRPEIHFPPESARCLRRSPRPSDLTDGQLIAVPRSTSHRNPPAAFVGRRDLRTAQVQQRSVHQAAAAVPGWAIVHRIATTTSEPKSNSGPSTKPLPRYPVGRSSTALPPRLQSPSPADAAGHLVRTGGAEPSGPPAPPGPNSAPAPPMPPAIWSALEAPNPPVPPRRRDRTVRRHRRCGKDRGRLWYEKRASYWTKKETRFTRLSSRWAKTGAGCGMKNGQATGQRKKHVSPDFHRGGQRHAQEEPAWSASSSAGRAG